MAQMQNTRPGEAGPGTGKTAGEDVNLTLPLGWHQQCEWESAASYALGFADGRAEERRALAEEITRAIGVQPYDRGDVIRWLVRTIGQPATRRAEPYSSPQNGTTLGVVERDVLGRWAA